jgi:TetR/AcrR family transcriptional regulator, mexJK operon transcriptional repressor
MRRAPLITAAMDRIIRAAIIRVDTLTPVGKTRDHCENMERRKATKAVGRGGRPSHADALLLRQRILKVAAELFLAQGYGSTTIEAVAAGAGISKRTFYHRFDDKSVLFAAVVHEIIEQIRPPAGVPLIEGATLRDVLRRLAGMILHAALSPQAIALHRLVMAESARFPELVRAVHGDGSTREATTLISGLLARELQDSKLSAESRALAAEQLIYMVVTVPQRRAMGYGTPMTAAELDVWADKAVDLFLNGCRGLDRVRDGQRQQLMQRL